MTDLTQVMPTTLPATANANTSVGIFQFNNFQDAMNAAQVLANSSLVPKDYRFAYEVKKGFGNNATTEWVQNHNAASNCLLALNIANRMGYDPLMIMQNLYIIEGRPAWSSQFIIAAINACGKFSPLRFDIVNHGEEEIKYTETYWENNKKHNRQIKTKIENISCVAWATEKATGERIESTKIDMQMAVKEGWYQKNGSKWQTMPDQMLRYRAAAFFGRIYAPEILMGIYSADEVKDFIDVTPEAPAKASADVEKTVVAEQIPCYDAKPLLDEIQAMQTLEQCTKIGAKIKGLSEDPTVNLCGDDLPKLRKAWKAKHEEIKAQFKQATTTTTEAPVQAEEVAPTTKPKNELSDSKKLVSDFVKAVNVATLEQNEELTATLFAMKPEIGDVQFNQLEGILDSKMNGLYEAMQAENSKETA